MQVPLRWADMDAFGHVNNAVYLRYLQEARVNMLYVHAVRQGAEGLADSLMVARHEIDYLAPLQFRPGPVRVETWVRQIRNATFTVGYQVLDTEDRQRVYALASTTLVPYDFTAVRSRRLGGAEKNVLARYLDPDAPSPRAGALTGGVRRENGTAAHSYRCAVRFDDFDSYGHVNNVMAAEYLQEARIDFARRLAGEGLSFQGSLVASQRIDYLMPVLSYTEPLFVDVWVTRLGGSSFDLAYSIHDDDHCYARGATTLVVYDVDTERTRELTAHERSTLGAFTWTQP